MVSPMFLRLADCLSDRLFITDRWHRRAQTDDSFPVVEFVASAAQSSVSPCFPTCHVDDCTESSFPNGCRPCHRFATPDRRTSTSLQMSTACWRPIGSQPVQLVPCLHMRLRDAFLPHCRRQRPAPPDERSGGCRRSRAASLIGFSRCWRIHRTLRRNDQKSHRLSARDAESCLSDIRECRPCSCFSSTASPKVTAIPLFQTNPNEFRISERSSGTHNLC